MEVIRRHTGPHVCVVGEHGPKVHPLRGIPVHGPALAQLRHGEPIMKLRVRPVDVGVCARVRLIGGRHLAASWFEKRLDDGLGEVDDGT